MRLAYGVGCLGEAEGDDDCHHQGHGPARRRECRANTSPQLRSTPPMVMPGRLSISASGGGVKTPVGRSKPMQVEEAKADREEHRAGQRLAGLHADGYGESSGEAPGWRRP